MGKIALSQHMSLDGFIQSPGPTDVPFKYRGWIMDFDLGPEGDRFQLEQAQNSEALMLGRVIYEAMQGRWIVITDDDGADGWAKTTVLRLPALA